MTIVNSIIITTIALGFFLEFMWHVVFGQDDELPSRADDVTLPLPLRLRLATVGHQVALEMMSWLLMVKPGLANG